MQADVLTAATAVSCHGDEGKQTDQQRQQVVSTEREREGDKKKRRMRRKILSFTMWFTRTAPHLWKYA